MSRPRKPTYQEIEGRVEQLDRERTLLHWAFMDALSDAIVWLGDAQDPDGDGIYRFGASRLDGAHGGLFFSVYVYPGQGDHACVEYLDDALACYERLRLHQKYYQLAAPFLFMAKRHQFEEHWREELMADVLRAYARGENMVGRCTDAQAETANAR